DADAAAERVQHAGGMLHRAPADVPGIGRFAVVADPQGAGFILFAPEGDPPAPVPAGTPGHVGWHELYADDWRSAFDFYAGQFGWSRQDAVDMGPMGTYQLFGVGEAVHGGMMNRPAQVPMPAWLFYFTVPAINAAAQRVADHGGRVLMGPHQ